LKEEGIAPSAITWARRKSNPRGI